MDLDIYYSWVRIEVTGLECNKDFLFVKYNIEDSKQN